MFTATSIVLLLSFHCINAGILDLLYPINERFIKYHIYTQSTEGTHVTTHISDPIEVAQSGFDNTKETYFCVNDCSEKSFDRTNTCQRFKRKVLSLYDVNYVYIDWSEYSSISYLVSYLAMRTTKIASIVSKSIDYMVDRSGLNLTNSQIVGASLGAELSGAIGAALDGRIGQLIGLDGAGSLFFHSLPDARISRKSARFVQVIHTGGFFGASGYFNPMGHSDYYPNGGERQSSCPIEQEFLDNCSHKKAVDLYLDTLNVGTKRYATKCGSMEYFKKGLCTFNEVSWMGGFHVDKNASGQYYSYDDGNFQVDV